MLRLTLLTLGWPLVALGPIYGLWRIWLGFNRAATGWDVDLEMMTFTFFVAVTPAIVLSGFGALLLMLVSLDRRLGHLEGKL
jgi:hypothetical protein